MPAVDDVFEYIRAQGLAGGSTGWTLRRRRLEDEPAQAVVVTEDGGTPPEIGRAAGIGDTALQDPGVLVTVRADEWKSDVSRAKAMAIIATLHGLLNVTLRSGGELYLRVRALTPEPVFAGFDERGRPLHTVAFRLLERVSGGS